jgi:hypothetical protein
MTETRGWIYVITNQAMPNLVKIGFSTKDPVLRAKELDNTGNPHEYIVRYDVLVRNPLEKEKLIHNHLCDLLENKEWFRCSVEKAISEIQIILKEDIIIENLGNVENLGKKEQCEIIDCTDPTYGTVQNTWYCRSHYDLFASNVSYLDFGERE